MTEPIGFKGTPGEWLYDRVGVTILPGGEETGQSYTISTDRTFYRKTIANAKALNSDSDMGNECRYDNETCVANMEIMTASKKMAVALQKIEQAIEDYGLDLDDTIATPIQKTLYCIKSLAKEALKQAGL